MEYLAYLHIFNVFNNYKEDNIYILQKRRKLPFGRHGHYNNNFRIKEKHTICDKHQLNIN